MRQLQVYDRLELYRFTTGKSHGRVYDRWVNSHAEKANLIFYFAQVAFPHESSRVYVWTHHGTGSSMGLGLQSLSLGGLPLLTLGVEVSLTATSTHQGDVVLRVRSVVSRVDGVFRPLV